MRCRGVRDALLGVFQARVARSRRIRRHLTARPFVGEGPGVRGRFTHSAPCAPDGGQRHNMERKTDLQMRPFISPHQTLLPQGALFSTDRAAPN
jgi:hypothetical protein